MMKKTMIGALVVTLALGMGNTVCAQKTKDGVFDLANYTLHDGGDCITRAMRRFTKYIPTERLCV